MSRTSITLAGAVLGSFLSVSAWAFPTAPVAPNASSDLILAAEGCGPGFHRGPHGHCRPDEHPVCGRGWHLFRGHCVRD